MKEYRAKYYTFPTLNLCSEEVSITIPAKDIHDATIYANAVKVAKGFKDLFLIEEVSESKQ